MIMLSSLITPARPSALTRAALSRRHKMMTIAAARRRRALRRQASVILMHITYWQYFRSPSIASPTTPRQQAGPKRTACERRCVIAATKYIRLFRSMASRRWPTGAPHARWPALRCRFISSRWPPRLLLFSAAMELFREATRFPAERRASIWRRCALAWLALRATPQCPRYRPHARFCDGHNDFTA